MKVTLLSIFLFFPFILMAQKNAASNSKTDSTFKQHKTYSPKEHFLFIGVNVNYLTVYDNGVLYDFGQGIMSTSGITNLHSMLPGFQVDYKDYVRLSHAIQFYYGAGFIYYHNIFDVASNSETFLGHTPQSPVSTSTISREYFNSNVLFIHLIVGYRFNVPHNIYFNLAVEPHIILYSLDRNHSVSYTESIYDTSHNVSSVQSGTTYDQTPLSAVNINGVVGAGYELWASHPHPLCFEINFAPDIFESTFLFDHSTYASLPGTSVRRSTIEFSVGYKF